MGTPLGENGGHSLHSPPKHGWNTHEFKWQYQIGSLHQFGLSEAGHQFTQALTTPFLQPPLLPLFSKANLNMKAFEQVLDGIFQCPPLTDPLTVRLIKALK